MNKNIRHIHGPLGWILCTFRPCKVSIKKDSIAEVKRAEDRARRKEALRRKIDQEREDLYRAFEPRIRNGRPAFDEYSDYGF